MAESLAVAPLPTPQDAANGTLYLASYFPSPSPPADFCHSQIPVSERCLDNATRVNREEEPSSVPIIPFQPEYDPYFNSQSMDNILSTGMINNPWQSYVRYTNSDQNRAPSSSTQAGSLSMPVEYSEEWYQQFEWLDPNPHPIPGPQSILSNHDADNSYNIVMAYAEFIGTAPNNSHSNYY